MFSIISSCCRAGVAKRVAEGVDAGRFWVGVGLGVEERENRGVALNCCWVLGRGVASCARGVFRMGAGFLIMNRCGDGVYGSQKAYIDAE